MRRRKGNNKGLSLVELIVTVAILAIIVLPLLRAFMVSSNTNSKAKKQQRTSELAQNIMEEIEASDLETLAMSFNYPQAPYLLGAESLQELRGTVSGGTLTLEKVKGTQDVSIPDYVTNPESMITSSIFKNGDQYKFIGQSSKQYYFALKNVEASGKKYDALIKLDGANATNAKDITSVYKMDQNHDAMSLAKQTPQTVLNTIQSSYPGVKQSDITRTITVDIAKAASTQVTVSYSYEFTANGVKVTYPAAGSIDAASYEDVVFDNSGETERELNNIYLFYYPWYTSTAGNRTDKIVIHNEKAVTAAFTLVKQEDGQTGLQNLEDNYSVDVTLSEPLGVGQSNTNLSIRTNLDENIANGKASIGKQGNYTVISNGMPYTNASALMGVGKLTEQSPSERLFDVTVEIYEAGSYDSNFSGKSAIISITGGMAN